VFCHSLRVHRAEKEKMHITALHGVAISIFYILVSSILSLGEWFVKAISEWEGFPVVGNLAPDNNFLSTCLHLLLREPGYGRLSG
jgi:hypothetical protein